MQSTRDSMRQARKLQFERQKPTVLGRLLALVVSGHASDSLRGGNEVTAANTMQRTGWLQSL
ncbi:MAG: hypothetical protein RIG62_24810 [Cyclobacteriaceae bacterium]